MKMRTKRAMLVAAGALALSLTLSGCGALASLIGAGDAPRDDTTGEVTEGADIDIFALQVGDCLPESAMSTGETTEAAVVPCAQPHGYEVYYEFELADGDFPGSDAIEAEVEAECLPAFNTFVGIDYVDSSLDVTWYEPTQESWESGDDRLVQCIIYDPAGEVEGSLEGSAR